MEKVYILGGEQTDFQRNWYKEGKTFLAMMREVVEDTVESIGIGYDVINALKKENRFAGFIGNFAGELYFKQGHLGAFLSEIHPSFIGASVGRFEAACASGAIAIDSAVSKIKSGEIDLALVVGIELMKTVKPSVGADYLGTAAYYEKEAKGVEFPFPKLFGQLADKILERYNLEECRFMNCLSEISRINYSNAKRNPKSQTRSWFANKEHTSQRYGEFNTSVGGKLCITDCSQITDGAAALFLASESFVNNFFLKNGLKPTDIPQIKGSSIRVAPVTFASKINEDRNNPYILPWTRQAVLDTYRQTMLTVKDIDVFETHDCFTSSEYVAISAFGITEPGREFEAIENGTIDFTGKKPINPSGGLIGVGHPVGASGVRMMLDLYKQITNKAGDFQVPNVRNGMMLNIGGSATTNAVFIVGN